MNRKSNLKVIEEIKSLKSRMIEGFTLETRFDQMWTILENYDLTEVKLTNGKHIILCVRILHRNTCRNNNILANSALRIIRTFIKEEGGAA